MIKAFISHSSAQKEFAQELVNTIGRDYCKIDCFDFEPAYKSIDEIFKAIDSCTIFVLLISKEALASSWVQKEIYKAKDKLTSGQLEQFWPYIIDSSLKLDDVPSWMAKDECFNLKYFVSPEMLRKDIEQKIRRLIWRENPNIMARETTIIGRSIENEAFEDKRFSNRGRSLRGLIISGRNGVGKDAFAKQCLYKLGKPKEIEPYRISLDVKEGIENFIIYLNLYCREYSKSELEDILSSAPKEKANIAVKLLNKLYDSQTIVFVEDNMACVLPNREVSEWLVDVIENPELNKQIGLFIKSCISPNSYIESDYPKLAHIQLLPLNKNDRKKLFYQYAEFYKLTDITDSDVNFFVDKLLQSPSQILNAVEVCANRGVLVAKQDIEHLILLGTKKMKPLLDMFMVDELSKNILIILSTFEFLSFDVLGKIFEEQYHELQNVISKMMVYGIVSTFGPSDSFVRLDHFICDYVKRNKIALPSDLETYVMEVAENTVTTDDITEDVSLYLFKVKRSIVQGHCDNKSFLIPSIVIKSLMDVYNTHNYKMVIKICDAVANDLHSYYKDIHREISYWACLALCRMAKNSERNANRFWTEIKNIDGTDEEFLKGFYFRNQGDYQKAERYYRQALEHSPNMQRAKRELVTVLLCQKCFDEALSLAKENFEKDSDNTYHIHAYFRCLVRKHNLGREDIRIINNLMEAVQNSYSTKKDELSAAMDIEYQAYVRKTNVPKMLQLISDYLHIYGDSMDVRRASNEYKLRQGIISKDTFEQEENKLLID